MSGATACDQMSLLVQADHDGELDAGQAAAVVAHLASCAACAALAADFASLSVALRAAGLSPPAPARLCERMRRVALGGQRRRRWGRDTAAFAAGLATAAGIGWLVLPDVVADGLAPSVVAAHLRALQPGHLLDVTSSDQHAVKPWFNGRLDYSPPVRDFADAGFPLIGGRLDYIGDRPVAVLVYHRAQHVIDLFAWPATPIRSPAEPTASRGYAVVGWERDGMHFRAVSDLNVAELASFADLWRR